MTTLMRRLALALGVVLLVSCDTRLPTQAGGSLVDDVVRPTIKFVLTGGTNNTVDVGAAASVAVTATDDKGVSTVVTTVRNGVTVIGADTVTLKPTALTTTRTIPLALVGLINGDKVTIRTTVTDVGFNTKTDSLVVTVADTIAPVITVNSSGASKALKGGDTLDVRLTASDSAGLKYVGYRLVRPRATDSLLVKADSTFVPTGTTPRQFGPISFKYVLPDTLPTGNYVVVGFARDASNIVNKVGASISFTVVDATRPKLVFTAPVTGGKINVGDSLLVTARLTDNIGVKSVTFSGVSARGNPALGTADTVVRYPAVTAPAGTGFPAGVRDTTISRYLKVLSPIDTLTDSLIVVGVVTDQSNNADTSRIKIRVVSGPNVIFISPVPGDSATRGAGLTVTIQATHAVGVQRLGFRIQGDPSWPTKLDTTIVNVLAVASKNVTFSATVQVPANAPVKTPITITPISFDVNGQDGSSAPATIYVRAGLPPGPRVFQSVPARVEASDSVTITALGNGITFVGFEMRDNTGALIKRDSIAMITPYPSTAVVNVPLNLPASAQGKRISVISFAYDQGGRIGYSLRAGATTSQPLATGAFVDSALVVYGKTYPLPANRNGTIADLQVDATRGNIFLSNINFGRLEVWETATKDFNANGIVVGSQPWGMALSRTAAAKDTLYVANSGGTNLSRVFIGGPSTAMKEDLSNRLKTRISLLYKVTEVRDQATSKIRITVTGPILFSDRPQFVEQGESGLLYISTKPTTSAPSGTVRYLNPAAPAPDERFMLDFATRGTDPNSWLVANVDNVLVTPAPASSPANDVLTICDHASGTTAAGTCFSSSNGVLATVTALKAGVPTSDVDARPNLDEQSLALTDTTFAATSQNGKVVTFGQGNTHGAAAKSFLAFDDVSSPDAPIGASPVINTLDLINNASDVIFGVALDKSGKTLGLHGNESYFAEVNFPFTQRLQGKKSTFATGAGIAFHPNADGVTTPAQDRLAFVASANGTIEAVDIAYYDFTRGALATKFNLYGPLRASLPFPGDPANVLFKLFGLSPKGLVVVDVTAADLIAGP